jgi:hypothetical protein
MCQFIHLRTSPLVLQVDETRDREAWFKRWLCFACGLQCTTWVASIISRRQFLKSDRSQLILLVMLHCHVIRDFASRKRIQEVPDLNGKARLLLGLRPNSWKCREGMTWHDEFYTSADSRSGRLYFWCKNFRQAHLDGPQNRDFLSMQEMGRSQWPCSLKHELSSTAQTLGSWVRIPLEAWMPVCVYSLCCSVCR